MLALVMAHIETCENTLGIVNVAALILNFLMHAGGIIAIFYFLKDKLSRKCKCVDQCTCGKTK